MLRFYTDVFTERANGDWHMSYQSYDDISVSDSYIIDKLREVADAMEAHPEKTTRPGGDEETEE